MRMDNGERWERCLWQMKRPERVAAVGERGSRSDGDESTGHRNRTIAVSLRDDWNDTLRVFRATNGRPYNTVLTWCVRGVGGVHCTPVQKI